MRVFGPVPVPGLVHVRVDDLALARLLGDADGRINRTGASLSEDGRLRVGSAPGLDVEPVRVADPGELAEVLAGFEDEVPTSIEVDLGFELAGGFSLSPRSDPEPTLWAPDRAFTVLAGPGVLRGGYLDALQRFAADRSVGVLNTWGAKGVFRWDSPHHLGTAGLQERDFELGGLGDAELIVAVGVDPREAPPDLMPPVEVQPLDLRTVTWEAVPPTDIPRPPLYTDLSAVVMPAYEDESVPLHPARAARELGAVVPEGGLVVADPGPAGFWIARTFPTTQPGSVIVPATRAPGFAAAAALVAGLDGRPAVGVTTAPVDPMTDAVLELAASLGVAVDLRVWGDDPDVDFSRTRDLVEVAGPVVAWTRER